MAYANSIPERWNQDDDSIYDEQTSDCWRSSKHNRSLRRRHASQRRPPHASELASGARERPAAHRQRPNRPEEFRCRHCRTFVVAVPSGGRHRNHCPTCLHSRHVDDRLPGDRASPCGATMAPIGAFVRPNGEHTLVHRCLSCGIERHNRIAADDDFALVLALPDMTRAVAFARLTAERRTSA